MDAEAPYVGMDVAKAPLEVAVCPSGASWTVPNDTAGIASLVAWLETLAPALVVLEATGGLELPLAGALAAARMPVAVVNPCQVRHLIQDTRTSSAGEGAGRSPDPRRDTRQPVCPANQKSIVGAGEPAEGHPGTLWVLPAEGRSPSGHPVFNSLLVLTAGQDLAISSASSGQGISLAGPQVEWATLALTTANTTPVGVALERP